MTKIYTPNHKCPISQVGISASQNVYGNQQVIDEKEAKSFLSYLDRGLMPSIKFARTAEAILSGYDENKAVFPQ